ncbi:hypothetical protein [Agrococcus sp. ProA11]|uniref:hypothetical protein n=1 Tax=Agrococcus chionoecetis TaxID=3153752 RepID=UPI003261186A
MHYLLGLAALVIGAIIATRRTRPTWFVVTTSVLVGVGALLAVLSYMRVTDPLGLVANSVLGWVFVGVAIMTMLSSIFVLERRGEFGEELPPLIGDNPFDGDTDDSDDPAPGMAPGGDSAASTGAGVDAVWEARAEAAASTSVTGAAAVVGVAGAAAAGSPAHAGVGASGTEALAQESAGEHTVPDRGEADDEGSAADHHGNADSSAAASPREEPMTTNDHEQRPGGAQPGDDGSLPGNPAMEAGLRASLGAGGGDPGAHTDERPAERADAAGAASDAGPTDDEASR